MKFLILLWAGLAQASSLNYETLKETIESKKLSSVPEVLANLPEDFRSNYNLIRDSLSLQQSSYAQPRVIFHTIDFKFILAFNGDPQMRGHDSLEMIQFRDEKKEFEFREIKFVEGKPEYSDPNPRKCQACHGISPRPFAGESGNDWNESFGATHDEILGPNEKKEFADFLKLRPDHERYKYVLRKNLSRNFPFSDATNDFNKLGDLSIRPNFRMSIFLGRLNAQRIAKYFFEAPFVKAKPYTALYWLNCDIYDLHKFDREVVTPAFQAQFPEDKFAWLYRELNEVGNGGTSGIGLDLFMMEKLLSGLEVRTWNMHRMQNHHGNNWIWFNGMFNQDELIRQEVFVAFAKTHSEFSQYVQETTIAQEFGDEFYRKVFRNSEYLAAFQGMGPIYDHPAAQKACEKLKSLSEQELK